MDIYARALLAVPRAERMAVLNLYVSRASDFFGITKVRRRRRRRQLHRWVRVYRGLGQAQTHRLKRTCQRSTLDWVLSSP